MPKKKVVEPISPAEALKNKNNTIPPEVIEAFNELIAKNFNGRTATILQKEVAALAANKLSVSTDYLYKNKWLDVEDVFSERGWEVDYDKPGFNESYDATFTFKARPHSFS